MAVIEFVFRFAKRETSEAASDNRRIVVLESVPSVALDSYAKRKPPTPGRVWWTILSVDV